MRSWTLSASHSLYMPSRPRLHELCGAREIGDRLGMLSVQLNWFASSFVILHGIVSMDAIVVGAGVVGVTAALALQKRGMRVMLLDQQLVAQGCSAIGAGVIYPGAFPSCTCYRVSDVAAALLRGVSVGVFAWRSATGLLSWGIKYARATSSDEVWHGTDLLHELCRKSLRSFELLLGTDLPPISKSGYLALHLSTPERHRAICRNAVRTSLGAASRIVSGGELGSLESALCSMALGPHTVDATFLAGSAHVADAAGFLAGLTDIFQQRGGVRVVDRVEGLQSAQSGSDTVRCTQRRYSAETVVIAAGAHSNHILSHCSHRIPLVEERGYQLELDVEPGFISRPISLPSLGVVLAPSERGATISGISHFGSPGCRPKPGLLSSALAHVNLYLPVLRARAGTEVHSGERPATPDSLPVIERVRGKPSIFVSTRHGHLGLTLAAVSARILADLVINGSSSYAGQLCSQRFQRRARGQTALRAA
jgi:glycine/D-amino acid oxidase-like deaminating enzyme